MQCPYYMKGNSRYLFGAVMAYLPFNFAVHFILFLMNIRNPLGVIPLVAALVLIDGAGAALLLLYGFFNGNELFRKLLVVLAGCQLLYLAHDLLYYLVLSGFVVNTTALGLDFWESGCIVAFYIAWIVTLSIVTMNKKTPVLVRVSAGPLLVFFLFCICIELSYMLPLPIMKLSSNLWFLVRPVFVFFHKLWDPTIINLQVMYKFIFVVLCGFFFAAISFSKLKPPKAVAPVGAAPLA